MNSGTTDNDTPPNEFPVMLPDVDIDGTIWDWINCIAIEDNTGIIPSKATLRVGYNNPSGGGIDLTGPITLNAYAFPFQAGSRVLVYSGTDAPMHLGNLMLRQDQGEDDNIVWTSLDDRVLYNQIVLRGAIVRDAVGGAGEVGAPKLITRYQPRTNPGGKWNCIGCYIDGTGNDAIDGQVWPVFSDLDYFGMQYQSPSQAYSGNLADPTPNDPSNPYGAIVPWTPRRWLTYCWLLSQLPKNSIQGTWDPMFRTLYDSDRTWFDQATIANLVGSDVSGVLDPLDAKMPDMQFQGETLLRAIATALEMAGTHGIRMDILPDTSTDSGYISYFNFFAMGFSGLTGTETGSGTREYNNIPIIRGGQVLTNSSVYDFTVHEDASACRDAVLVEGQNMHLETQLTYTGQTPNIDNTPPSTDGVIAEWTIKEQQIFNTIVNGGTEDSPGAFALYPPAQSILTGLSLSDTSGWLVADGTLSEGVYKPLAYAKSQQAVQLARSILPRVYKSFSIYTPNIISALYGVGTEYSDEYMYPILYTPRRLISGQQLQFYIRQLTSGDDQQNWLNEKLPIRIQLYQANANPAGYVEVQWGSGVRQDSQGLLHFDGICENLDGQPDCIYDNWLMFGNPFLVQPKNFILNLAMVMDHRVQGYVELDPSESSLNSDFRAQTGGPPLLYIDSPQAYFEEHQVNSFPAALQQYYDGTDSLTQPLNRLLPPGTEQPHAQYAAQRRLYSSHYPHRVSAWRLPGIHDEYRAGDWIDAIEIVSDLSVGPDGDTNYIIDAPLESVVYDFMNQVTVSGGLLSDIASNKVMAKSKAQVAKDWPTKGPGPFPRDMNTANMLPTVDGMVF